MKIKNKLLTAGVALSIFFSVLPQVEAISFEESYDYLLKNDYARNYSNGEFLPYRDLTRDEAAWFLSLSSFDYNYGQETSSSFADVDKNSFYAPHIEKAKRLGIMNGTSSAEFNPGDKITRYQAAAILGRAFNIKKDSSKYTSCFEDVNSSHWAKSEVCSLNELGVINGKDGKFKGDDYVTRAQFSMMYARLLQKEFSLEDLDYVFEDEVLNSFYFQEGRSLVKVDSHSKLSLDVIQKMKKVDKIIKEQKAFLGLDFEKLMEIEPVSFVITKSKYIDKNGGFYHHKGETNPFNYLEDVPETHLVAVSNDFNDDVTFKRILIHELGHYIGYSAMHKNQDYTSFDLLKKISPLAPNKGYIKGWGDRKVEAFADSYTEIAISNFENRTFVGNFRSVSEKAIFEQWIRDGISQAVNQ